MLKLNYQITKVVNLWKSANEIIFQLGGGGWSLMVEGLSYLKTRPWMTQIYPRAAEIYGEQDSWK